MNRSYEAQRTAAQKIVDADIKERVLRGLEVLKEEYGEEWVNEIDPDKLDLSSSRFCVLGQLEGSFEKATDRIDLGGSASYFGFDSGLGTSYGALTEAWKRVGGWVATEEEVVTG